MKGGYVYKEKLEGEFGKTSTDLRSHSRKAILNAEKLQINTVPNHILCSGFQGFVAKSNPDFLISFWLIVSFNMFALGSSGNSQEKQQQRMKSDLENNTPGSQRPIKRHLTRVVKAEILANAHISPSGRLCTNLPYDIPEDMLPPEDWQRLPLRYHQGDSANTTPIKFHDAPLWEPVFELDEDDEVIIMTDDGPPQGEGEPVDIEAHHLPGIQAIVGDQLDLHPWSTFPRNRAEIDQAAAILQHSSYSPEHQVCMGCEGSRVTLSSAEESRVQTGRSPSFCMTGSEGAKRRRLSGLDQCIITIAEDSDEE